MSYQLTKFNVIRRLEDGASIPMDESNADYRAYLRWKVAGNEPLPVEPDPEPTVQQKIAALEAQQTPRLLREAALGGEYANAKLLEIDNKIKELREKL